MTEKTAIIKTIGNYFASKGKALTYEEYREADDAPVRIVLVKRAIGSWARLLNIVGDISQYSGVLPVEPVYTVEDQDELPIEEEKVVPLEELTIARKLVGNKDGRK